MFTQVQGPLGEVKPLRPALVYCTAWRGLQYKGASGARGGCQWLWLAKVEEELGLSPNHGILSRHEGPGHLIKRCPGYSEETQTTVAMPAHCSPVPPWSAVWWRHITSSLRRRGQRH